MMFISTSTSELYNHRHGVSNPHIFLRVQRKLSHKKIDNTTKYLFIFVLIIKLLRNTIGSYISLPALEKRLWFPFVEILSERFNFR